MASQTIPKAEIKINSTIHEYKEAWLLTERTMGWLRQIPAAVFVSAALLLAGMCSFNWFRQNYSTVFFPLLLCILCPIVLMFYFIILPQAIKFRAAKDFKTHLTLMGNASLQLYADNAVTQTETLTFNDPYALMVGCVETPMLFVLIKDHERILIIPKRCLPPERAEEISDFLRHVFARRRRVMKCWVF